MAPRDYSQTPSYTPADLAVLEHVLKEICTSRKWSPTSEESMRAGRFLLAQFDDGIKDPARLRELFEKGMAEGAWERS